MRKIAGLLTAALLCVLLPVQAQAVSARSAVVLDGATGQVLFEQNADERLPMASTTKIMTAIVAIENFDIDREYVVKKEYTRVEGSSMYLKEGERITLRDTLYGLMLMSGNDAALAIAGECGGLQHFVGLMNATAERLGLTNTHFDNPNGLDGETHYTTARELAELAAYGMRNEQFREIVSTKSYQAGGRYMKNHNKLLTLYADCVGVKTGFTKKSGRCLVSAAERNGRRLVAVTLNAPDDWNDHMSMLQSAFQKYQPYTLHEAGAILRTQPVEGGTAMSVDLAAKNTTEIYLTQREYEMLKTVFLGSRFTYAPVEAGDLYGKVEYCVGDTVLAEDDLIYQTGTALLPEEKSVPERFWDRLRSLWAA
ncbi:MAG: D-alanyl-D-alanine carboxypeptidase family protein [Intestinibacillus sp.]